MTIWLHESQYHKGSFIPRVTFFSQNTHFELKFIPFMQAFLQLPAEDQIL